MKKDKTKKGAVILQMPKQTPKNQKESEKKWGRDVMSVKGFCIVPSLLMYAQRRLHLTPVQLNIVLHLADHWWDADRKPFPTKTLLAERMGMSARQVQRNIADMEKRKLIQRIERRAAHRGKIANEYDMSGLVAKLKELEPEFRQVDKEAKRKQHAVTKLGFKSRKAEA